MTTLRARSDRRYVRSAHRSERFVLVEVEAPSAPQTSQREPVNLAFVLDRSGSMSGEKLALARQAIETAVDRLLPSDRFAIVCYDDRVDVVVEATPASREAKTNAIDRLRQIDARGSTDLGGGWLRGAEQVALSMAPTGVNRTLVLTDGLANVGIVDPQELAGHARELRARGVTTTTFGVGADFDEALLQSMADAGGGHFYFIENAAQIHDHIATEVGELLQVVARDVALEVTAPETVVVSTLTPHPVEQGGGRIRVLVGDLVAEQRVEVLVRVRFGYGPIGQDVGLLVAVTDRDGVLAAAAGQPVSVRWEFADDRTNDTQPRDRAVDRVVAKLFAARARQDAVQLNRHGDLKRAAGGVRAVADRIAAYAGNDPVLQGLVAELRAEDARWSAPMAPMALKSVHAAASYAMRSRAPSGGANR